MNNDLQQKEKLVNSVVKAIAYAENGGKPNLNNPSAGKSGELKSIFQFEPSTWKQDAKKILGNENAPLTADNETFVMQHKVAQWISEGKNVNEMASIHNSGNPNAYKENHKGTNKYGVKYDTPAYAKKVQEYAKQFYSAPKDSNIDSTGTALSTEKTPMKSEALDTIMSTISNAKKNSISQPETKTSLAPKLNGLFGGNVKSSVNKVSTSEPKQKGLLSKRSS